MKITETNTKFKIITSDYLTERSRKQNWLSNNKEYKIIGFLRNCFIVEMDKEEFDKKGRAQSSLNIEAEGVSKYDKNKYKLFLIHYTYFYPNIAEEMVEYFKK